MSRFQLSVQSETMLVLLDTRTGVATGFPCKDGVTKAAKWVEQLSLLVNEANKAPENRGMEQKQNASLLSTVKRAGQQAAEQMRPRTAPQYQQQYLVEAWYKAYDAQRDAQREAVQRAAEKGFNS